jgi:hypothetical protein
VRILILAPHPFFQPRGQLDLLTFHEGENVAIPNCRIHRIARPPWIRKVRAGFSLKKVVCDIVMFVKSVRMVRRNRYDLIHAVEESAFIAAAIQRLTGSPYVYDMDPPEPEALGDGVAELLRDPVLRERLATQAKAYVQQEFTPEAAKRKLSSFYSMMESRASGAAS